MSRSNCCFLTCIQVSHKAGQEVWYSHLFQNFPQFIVIHRVKGFGIVNKAEIDVFVELSCFLYDSVDVGHLVSGSSASSKTSLNIWSSRFTYYWSLARRILSITLLACEMSAIVQQFEHSLGLPFFGIGMKTDLFQCCGDCWVFQICWHIECSTFTASSFRATLSRSGDIDDTHNKQKQTQRVRQNEKTKEYFPNKRTRKSLRKKRELNETEISNSSDKEFKVTVIEMLTELGKRVDELGENVNKETEKYKKEPVRTEKYNN